MHSLRMSENVDMLCALRISVLLSDTMCIRYLCVHECDEYPLNTRCVAVDWAFTSCVRYERVYPICSYELYMHIIYWPVDSTSFFYRRFAFCDQTRHTYFNAQEIPRGRTQTDFENAACVVFLVSSKFAAGECPRLGQDSRCRLDGWMIRTLFGCSRLSTPRTQSRTGLVSRR